MKDFIIDFGISVFNFIKNILCGYIVKKTKLKGDLEYGCRELNNLITEYQYSIWNSGLRTRKLDSLHRIYESIQSNGSKKLKSSEVSFKIKEAIDNIDNYKNVDDIIQICAKLSHINN